MNGTGGPVQRTAQRQHEHAVDGAAGLARRRFARRSADQAKVARDGPAHDGALAGGAHGRVGVVRPAAVGGHRRHEDEVYLALYSAWQDPADDTKYADWPVSHMRALEPLATGIQLADENLGQRPARFLTDEHLARVERLRALYDPEQRFHSWMGRP